MSVPGDTLAADDCDDVCWRFLEISRAHPNCYMRLEVYTALHREHPECSKGRCGLLVKTLSALFHHGHGFGILVRRYGTDAAAAWAACK